MSVLSAASGLGSTFSSDVLALNPISYWQLNGNLNDSSGNGNNGSSSSGVVYTAGAPIGDPSNQGLSVNASSPDVIVPNAGGSMNFEYTNSFSVMAWINVPSTFNSSFGDILSHESASSLGYFLGITNAGNVSFETTQGGASEIGGTSGGGNNDGKWHFIVGTYAGGSTVDLQLYIDGVAVAGNIRGNNGSISDPGGSVTLFCCGQNDGVFPWASLTSGEIDEAAIFGSALSASQVSTLYSAASAPQGGGAPEPSTLLMLGAGLAAVLFFRNHR